MALLSYPIFLKNGESFDLRTLYTQTVFEFATDSEHPTWLTIESDYELTVARDAVSETTPAFVELDNSAELYIVVNPATAPSLRADIDALNMLTDSSYDLFLIVQNADSIAFEAGQTQPTGSSISDGVFTIGTANGTAYFTATNDDGDTDFAIKINTVQRQRNLDEFSDTKRTRVEIAGIDVSEDFLDISELSETLDAITLTDFTVDDATLVLSSDNTNGYRYNDGVANNFWQTNNLNAGGYQASINIFDEYLVNDVWVSHVVFSGVILRATENFEQTQVSLICVDVSSRLRNRIVADFGTLEKWGVLTTEDTASDFEKEYTPEEPLLPIQVDTGQAWQDSGAITLQQASLPTEGLPPSETLAQITETSLKTRSLLAEDPLLNFKTQPKNRSLQWAADQLAITSDAVYQVNLDVDTIALDSPYMLNLGNTAFNIEKTRITRLPVDWVYDPTHHRVLSLLSTTAEHISDILVEYDIQRDRRKIVYAFAKNLKTLRIARRDATHYYILTTEKGTTNYSGSIYEYDTATETLTQHVSETDTHRARWAVLYQDDLFTTGVDYLTDKGTFKCVGDDLYYRYASGSDVGVAQLDTAGTTTSMIDESDATASSFAFDVTDSGEIYLATHSDGTDTITVASDTTTGAVTNQSLTINNDLGGLFAVEVSARITWSNNRRPISSITINGFRHDITTLEGLTGTGKTISLGNHSQINSLSYTVSSTSNEAYPVTITVTAKNPESRFLKIQHRATDGTIETLHEDTASDTTRPLALHELRVEGDYLFLLLRAATATAGSYLTRLLRYDLSSGAPLPDPDVIESYATTKGAVHLFTYQSTLYFMHSLALYTLLLPNTLGSLNRIESDGSVTSLGNLWYEDGRAYAYSMLRPLVIGDDIHFVMGYGNTQGSIFNNDSFGSNDPAQADNFYHVVRTTQLRYFLSNATFSGSPYDALSELARLVNATLSFEQNIVHIRDRSALTAETNGNTGV